MNQSFTDVACQLREMGVRNVEFLIRTLNEHVIPLDPLSSSTLTDKQKGLIAEECKNNFWYYLREVATTQVSEYEFVPLKLNIATCAFFYLYHNNISTWFQHSRQTGTTIAINHCKQYTATFYPKKTILDCEILKDRIGLISLKENLYKRDKHTNPCYLGEFCIPYERDGKIHIYDEAERNMVYDIFLSNLKSTFPNVAPPDMPVFHYNSAVMKGTDERLVRAIDELPTFDVSMFDMDIEELKTLYPIIKIKFPINQVITDTSELTHYLKVNYASMYIDDYMREVLMSRV